MTKTGPQRAVLRRLVFTFWVAILFGANASTVVAGPQAPAERGLDRDVTFNIPPQPLGPALVQFSKQADVQVMVAATTVDKQTTSGVTGTLRVRTALADLLRNSGLTYTAKDDTVTVTPVSASGVAKQKSFRLAEADASQGLEADGLEDRSDGPTDSRHSDLNEDESAHVEQVVVTGTHIRGVESASPVAVYGADQIERTGSTTLEQFMATLPQNSGGGATELTANALIVPTNFNIPGDTSANLHGLGSQATLTLINGQRVAAGGFGTYVDISMIPLSAIDRIEILTDGASALYGSDAVAGVVNIILKEHLSGAESLADYGSIAGAGHARTRLAQALGTDWSAGGAMIAYDFSKQFRLPSDARSFTPTPAIGSDLVPSLTRQSVFGALSYKFGDALSMQSDFLYSHKATDTVDILFDAIGAREEQYSAVANVSYRISDTWGLTVSPNWSENHLRSLSFATASAPYDESTTSFNTSSVNGVVTGDLFGLGHGGVAKVAAGTEYRKEGIHYFDTVSSNAFDRGRRRSIAAAFGELNLPFFDQTDRLLLLDEFTATVAGRFEHYSDFGNSTNTKFGLRWKPAPSILIRATTGTSFRAPPLYYLSGGSQAVVFPLADPAASAGRTASLVLAGVGPNLGPERARSTTAGLSLQPEGIPSLKASLDLFQTHYFGRIQSPAPAFLGMLVNSTDYENFIIRGPTAQQVNMAIANADQFINPFHFPVSTIGAIVDNRVQNVASVEVRGADFGVQYAHWFGSGRVDLDVNAEHIFSFDKRLTPTSQLLDIVNTTYNPPRWKVRSQAGWTRGGLSLSTAGNYVGSYTNDQIIPKQPIRAFTTIDCRASYDFLRSRASLLSGVGVSLSAVNVFNRAPPTVLGSFAGYDSANANPFGRLVTAEVKVHW